MTCYYCGAEHDPLGDAWEDCAERNAVTVPDDARNINPTDLRVWPVDYSLPG